MKNWNRRDRIFFMVSTIVLSVSFSLVTSAFHDCEHPTVEQKKESGPRIATWDIQGGLGIKLFYKDEVYYNTDSYNKFGLWINEEGETCPYSNQIGAFLEASQGELNRVYVGIISKKRAKNLVECGKELN